MRVTIVQANLAGGVWIPAKFYNVQGFGLANALADKGCEVTLLTSNRMLSAENGKIPWRHRHVEQHEKFKVVYLPTLGIYMKQAILPTLAREIALSKPDVVQTDEDVYLSTVYAVAFCSMKKIPVLPWQGTFFHVRKKTVLHKLYCRTLGRIVYRQATRFMAKSTQAKDFLYKINGVPQSKIDLTLVGINYSRFAEADTSDVLADLGLPKGKILLGVGRLSWEKDQAFLIRAMKEIAHRTSDCFLVLFGRGPEEESLKQLVKKLNLTDRVFIVNKQIPNDQMSAVYKSAFLHLMPSPYEVFGMTALESLACGTPVIARRVGGMADVIKEGEVGFLFDTESELCDAVCKVMSDPELYSRMTSKCPEYAKQFDWMNIADNFIRSYKLAIDAMKK